MLWNGKNFREEIHTWIKNNYSHILGKDIELLDKGEYDLLVAKVRNRFKF
jgi:hypothetical protein